MSDDWWCSSAAGVGGGDNLDGDDAEIIVEFVSLVTTQTKAGVDVVGFAEGVSQHTLSEIQVISSITIDTVSKLIDGCAELVA